MMYYDCDWTPVKENLGEARQIELVGPSETTKTNTSIRFIEIALPTCTGSQ